MTDIDEEIKKIDYLMDSSAFDRFDVSYALGLLEEGCSLTNIMKTVLNTKILIETEDKKEEAKLGIERSE